MDRQALKPPFAYYGGKTTLAPKIASLLPPHEHYVEPFAGSLAVLLAKKPSRAETVNDLDGDLMTFWRVLRDRPEELERACALTPHSRAEYELSRSFDGCEDELELSRRVFVRLTQGRSHTMDGRAGWWRRLHPAGFAPADYTLAYAIRLANIAERMRSVSLESRDAVDVIREYGPEPSVCLYVDPPYLGSTRSKNYRHELLGDDAHQALADALRDCNASVVLSGYDSPLYADLFSGWHRIDLPGATTLSGDTDRVEVLWSNAPLAETLALDFGEVTA